MINRECQFMEHASLSREVAAAGMVLLKNENQILPLRKKRIAVFGKGQLDYYQGGTGSARVDSAYCVDFWSGLEEKAAEEKLILDEDCRSKYIANEDYLPSVYEMREFAVRNDVALLVISRNAGEGSDRQDVSGDWQLAETESALIDQLKQSGFQDIVLIINAGGLIELEWAADNSQITAILYTWQPGMEGGAATADILCGDINPSGRLTDTIARKYMDYPSSGNFDRSPLLVPYEEDIFVGYRYFSTIPGATEKVLYPFGFGLSYTTFSIDKLEFNCDDSIITVSCRITNTGDYAGREVIQLYSSQTNGLLEHPELELRDYYKTPLLHPQESCSITLTLAITDLVSFDDTGLSGEPGSWIIDNGTYHFALGKNVQDIVPAGSIIRENVEVLSIPGLKLTGGLAHKLQADGSCSNTGLKYPEPAGIKKQEYTYEEQFDPEHPILLSQVASGEVTLDEFMEQLSRRQLVELCQAQPPAFPLGTAGIGNMPLLGVPNPQTADGPAGLRKSVPTTCFPCATLLACSFDPELLERVGKALGYEGIATGVDILLAPGLNIHRNPLCGRNFEYYSEDPLLSGKCAAAIVRGIQSEGLGATIKHFTCNNREWMRMEANSIVSERALREIYLKGFEIAVKESSPWCIMSSYNLLNGVRTSCNYNLLTGILRDEWGFNGVVMTDWRNPSHLWREISAGNDIKMPFGYPEEIDSVEFLAERNVVSRPQLWQSARRVLELVMKTHRFKQQDFGFCHTISSNRPTHIKAMESTAISATWTKCETCQDHDGGMNHCKFGLDQRGNDCYLIYLVDVERSGDFAFSVRFATALENIKLELTVDDDSCCIIEAPSTGDWQQWQTTETAIVSLPAGRHVFKLYVRNGISREGVNINYFDFQPSEI